MVGRLYHSCSPGKNSSCMVPGIVLCSLSLRLLLKGWIPLLCLVRPLFLTGLLYLVFNRSQMPQHGRETDMESTLQQSCTAKSASSLRYALPVPSCLYSTLFTSSGTMGDTTGFLVCNQPGEDINPLALPSHIPVSRLQKSFPVDWRHQCRFVDQPHDCYNFHLLASSLLLG